MQKIALLGGSFDPIHYGHLAIAHEAAWALGLERVLLLPAAQQPLKAGRHAVSAEARLAMVELACANDPLLEACDIEVRRQGPSYTVDTLRELRSHWPAATLFFIVGADALADLPRWYRATEIATLCTLVAVERPGTILDLQALEQALPVLTRQVIHITGPQLAISSSTLRHRIAAGQPVRYQLPDSVLHYIEHHRLYRDI